MLIMNETLMTAVVVLVLGKKTKSSWCLAIFCEVRHPSPQVPQACLC